MHMPAARRHQYIVVARDDLTKYPQAQPLKWVTAQAITNFVHEDLIYCHECIGQIVSDNGPEFQGALAKLLNQHNLHIPLQLISKQMELWSRDTSH